MKGTHKLSSGFYLFTALNKYQKKKYLTILSEKVGCFIKFKGEWDI